MQVQPLNWEDLLEEGMATHSSILPWRIPKTEEPGRLQSMGSTESDTTEVTQHTYTQTFSKMFPVLSQPKEVVFPSCI